MELEARLRFNVREAMAAMVSWVREGTAASGKQVLLDVHSQLFCNFLGAKRVRSVECGRDVAIARVRLRMPLFGCSMRLFETTYRGFIDVGRSLLDGR